VTYSWQAGREGLEPRSRKRLTKASRQVERDWSQQAGEMTIRKDEMASGQQPVRKDIL
jgi:hypothetical protein